MTPDAYHTFLATSNLETEPSIVMLAVLPNKDDYNKDDHHKTFPQQNTRSLQLTRAPASTIDVRLAEPNTGRLELIGVQAQPPT
jgi:hypothetical protein